jgi:hypothetical protein
MKKETISRGAVDRYPITPADLCSTVHEMMPFQSNIIHAAVAFSQSRNHLAYRMALRCPLSRLSGRETFYF